MNNLISKLDALEQFYRLRRELWNSGSTEADSLRVELKDIENVLTEEFKVDIDDLYAHNTVSQFLNY